MKYVKLIHETPMNPVETFEGEFIEEKVARVVENKEPIEDGAPIIYTERKDGVIPAYNIRTDKWDIALTAMDQVNKNWGTKNMEKPGTFAEDVPDTIKTYRDWETDRKSTRLNSSHRSLSRMPSSA